jgi:DNA polymerase elongation subunit (family B)
VDVQPGQIVEFVITDAESKDARRRVAVRELWDGEAYDAAKYVELLARACEELFSPFGYEAEELKREWTGRHNVERRPP